MPASATAPVMPRDPPMIKAVPNVPLCASEGRGGRVGKVESREVFMVHDLESRVIMPRDRATFFAIIPATYPPLKPASILTTLTFDAQLFSIPINAARPP